MRAKVDRVECLTSQRFLESRVDRFDPTNPRSFPVTRLSLLYFERRESSEIFTNKQTGGNGNALFVVRSRAGISMIRAFNETSIPGIAPEIRDC